MIQLPPYDDGVEQQPTYDYWVTLTDVEYRLVVAYRERNDRWYLTIYNADNEALLSNKKLSVNTSLISRHQIAGLPPGDFVLWDTSGAEAECGYDDLGIRCVLIYFEPDEIPAPASNDISIEAV